MEGKGTRMEEMEPEEVEAYSLQKQEYPPEEEDRQDDLHEKYSSLTDEEIVARCHEGESLAEEYLLDKYKNFVRSKARSYFLIAELLPRLCGAVHYPADYHRHQNRNPAKAYSAEQLHQSEPESV